MPVKNTIIPDSFSLDAVDYPGTALTIGNFDGVHCGHASLLYRLKKAATQRGLAMGVMTFTPHPREYFALLNKRPELIPTRISTLRDKICSLRLLGADFVSLSHFNEALAHTSPTAYIDEILVKQLKLRYLLVGQDFRFGHKREGDLALLRTYGQRHGFEVETIEDVNDSHGIRYSSTELRNALSFGDIAAANRFLGRPYSISGRVTHGKKLGRTLGYPTLNIKLMPHCAIRSGVYVVKVRGLIPPTTIQAPSSTSAHESPLHQLSAHYPAMAGIASLGVRPTVTANGEVLLEVHLIDTNIDAYGKLVTVEFLQHVRDEEKFPNLETLVSAMNQDLDTAREYFNQHGL
ncbi:riboflavin biosynthesis protein RibF [Oligella urethralis]|uniref:riboflavin biosynthesis protein RibF n=1 Tax=Oligella urethralis TaxID=90245 RepID=UPI000D009934|nr:riboflavin biosynthesis protein RibF [Oligella urethralis]AVL70667.1 riboflavin biosynthesis protein RibF [Oligella urethralis]